MTIVEIPCTWCGTLIQLTQTSSLDRIARSLSDLYERTTSQEEER